MSEHGMSRAAEREHERSRSHAQEVRVVPAVINGCLIVAALIVFNACPESLGLIRSATEPANKVLALGPEFFQDILPRLNVLWGFSLAVVLTNLYYGRWSWGTRLLDYALTIFGVAILAKLLFGGQSYLILEWQSLEMLAIQVAGRTVPLVLVGVKAALAGALLGAVLSLVTKVRPLIHNAVRLEI